VFFAGGRNGEWEMVREVEEIILGFAGGATAARNLCGGKGVGEPQRQVGWVLRTTKGWAMMRETFGRKL
jgi:hypothetical protein